MPLNDRVTSLTKRIAAKFATLLAAVLVLAFGAAAAPGVAAAAPGENIPDSETLVSKTGTADTWVQTNQVNAGWWNQNVLVPGSENKTTIFVKNASAVKVDAQFFLGEWSVSAGSAYFSVETAGGRVPNKVLTGNWNTNLAGPGIMVAITELSPGEQRAITFITGLPATEPAQNATINPDWSIAMEEKAGPVDPSAPAAPTGMAANPNPAKIGEDVTISGKAVAGSTVKVMVGNGAHDATVDGSGSFAYTFKPAAAGTVGVTAKATKGGLTSAASAEIALVVDASDPSAPAAPTGMAANPNPAKVGEDVTISGKAVAGSTVKVMVGNDAHDATVDGSGNFTYTFKPAAAGTFGVTAKATRDGLTSAASTAVSLIVNADDPGTGSAGSLNLGSLDLGSLTSIFGSAASAPASAPVSAPSAGSLSSPVLHS